MAKETKQQNPPWICEKKEKCTMLDGFVKANISTTALRQVTLAHMARHSNSLKLYTDSSKNDNGTAFAVWQHHVLVAKKIPKICSIYTAKAPFWRQLK